ncbi:Hypothetical protein NTJ_11448 [Nesidiocoris tenuis]|uniref:Uncharacterized protein n=1 Tax=Nesidiocoris tenuis TaxID=355587 RepID=A0ABN7B303_9HEMI|nr:Hypothetical protein NTJ_11448 [Nesidiocoris tenuis]
MASLNTIAMMAAALITFLSTAEGFFLYSNKKSSTERVMPPPNYYRDAIQASSNSWGAQYAFDGAGPVTVALPVAVPIQAQMAPVPPTLKGTVHNVQLVPCLCPVSKDVDTSYYSQIQQQQPQQSSQPTGYVNVVQAQQNPSQTN